MKSPIRILLVIPTLELGGAERQAIRLAKYLQDKNHAVEVWGFNSPEGLGAKFCNELGIQNKCLHFYGGLGRYRYPLQLFKFILKFRSFKPDIIYSFTDGPNVLCSLIWKYTGAKGFIWGQRSNKVIYPNKKLLNKALNNCKLCISNSQIGINELKDIYRNHKLIQFHKVPNGVEIEKPILNKEEWKLNLNLNDDTKVALMIANFSEILGKDQKTLIRAWQKVQQNNPNTLLLLAGRFDNHIDEYIQLAIELRILHSIRFLGKVIDIAGLISVADIIVHSSNNEGLPNAILEGMKCNKAITATDIPGIREALPETNLKFLSAPYDHQGLANNILNLINNEDLRIQLAKDNLEYANDQFDLNNMGSKSESILLRIIN